MKRLLLTSILCVAILTGCGGAEQTETAVESTAEVETTMAVAETTAVPDTTETTTQTETTAAEETTTETTTTIPEPTEEEEGGEFDVEKGFFVTTITYPLSMLEDLSNQFEMGFDAEGWRSEFETNADIKGVESSEIVGDTLVVKFKTSEYNKMRKQLKSEIEDSAAAVVNDTTNSIVKIEYDDDFSNIYAYVSSEDTYNQNFDSLKLIQFETEILFSNVFYDFFANQFTVHVIDSQTGAEFSTETYPK